MPTNRINRRTVLAAALAVAITLPAAALAGEKAECGPGKLNESGLHVQPWFVQDSFLDLKEELAAAKEEGKHFVVLVEQKGCPYCKTMHEHYFTDPEICNLVRNNFRVLQLDLRGDREVTDFDGKTMPEKQWAKTYLKLRITPSLVFFAGKPEDLAKKPAQQRPAAAMEGLYNPFDFKALFLYVKEDAFKGKSWKDFRREQWSKGAKGG